MFYQFLLHLREEAVVSQTAVDATVEGVDVFVKQYSESIKVKVLSPQDCAIFLTEFSVAQNALLTQFLNYFFLKLQKCIM